MSMNIHPFQGDKATFFLSLAGAVIDDNWQWIPLLYLVLRCCYVDGYTP